MEQKIKINTAMPALVIGVGKMGEQVLKSFKKQCLFMGNNSKLGILALSYAITDDNRTSVEEQISEKIRRCCSNPDVFDITVITVIASGSCFYSNLLCDLPEMVQRAGMRINSRIRIQQISFIFMPDQDFLQEYGIDREDQKICGINALVRLGIADIKAIKYVIISSENSKGLRQHCGYERGIDCVSKAIYELAVNNVDEGTLKQQMKGISSLENVSFYFPVKELFHYIVQDVVNEMERFASVSIKKVEMEFQNLIYAYNPEKTYESISDHTDCFWNSYIRIDDAESFRKDAEKYVEQKSGNWMEAIYEWVNRKKITLDGGVKVLNVLFQPRKVDILLKPLDCAEQVEIWKEETFISKNNMQTAQNNMKQAKIWNRAERTQAYQDCCKKYINSLKQELIWTQMQNRVDELKNLCNGLYKDSCIAMDMLKSFSSKIRYVEILEDLILEVKQFHKFLEYMDLIEELELDEQEQKSIQDIYRFVWDEANTYRRNSEIKGSCSGVHYHSEIKEDVEIQIRNILEDNFTKVRSLSFNQWLQGLASFIHFDKCGYDRQYPISTYLWELCKSSLTNRGVRFPIDSGKKIANPTRFYESIHVVAPESVEPYLSEISGTWHKGVTENRILFQSILADLSIEDSDRWNSWRKSGYILNDLGMKKLWGDYKNDRDDKIEDSIKNEHGNIDELNSIPEKPYMFFSYSHRNREIVNRCLEEMRTEGYEIWIDKGIEYGSNYIKTIAHAIGNCDLFCVFLSEEYQLSDFSRKELFLAKKVNCPIIVVCLNEMEESDIDNDISIQIGMDQHIKVWEYSNFKEMISDTLNNATPQVKQALKLCCQL